jgi:hypothetical protein
MENIYPFLKSFSFLNGRDPTGLASSPEPSPATRWTGDLFPNPSPAAPAQLIDGKSAAATRPCASAATIPAHHLARPAACHRCRCAGCLCERAWAIPAPLPQRCPLRRRDAATRGSAPSRAQPAAAATHAPHAAAARHAPPSPSRRIAHHVVLVPCAFSCCVLPQRCTSFQIEIDNSATTSVMAAATVSAAAERAHACRAGRLALTPRLSLFCPEAWVFLHPVLRSKSDAYYMYAQY